ncbi:MAG: M1 family aminopeptidase [Acidobacteriota bacterium]
MFKEIYTFEFRYQLRQPLFAICFVLFFLLTFGAVTSDAVIIGDPVGNLNRNASLIIMQFMLIMSMIGVFVATAFVSNSVYRDFEYNTDSLFFTTPITRFDFLGGRFLGSLTLAFLVFLGVASAIMIGSFMPWLEAERIGPFMFGPYLFSMFVLVLPNIFLTGAIFFSIATLTRSMLYTYAGVVAFFVCYGVAASALGDLQNEFLLSLLDPFGLVTFGLMTKYWTIVEKNTAIIPLQGALLYNRLIWVGLGAAVLLFTYSRFRFTAAATSVKRAARKGFDELATAERPAAGLAQLVASQAFSRLASLRQYLYQTRIEFLGIVKGIPFLILLFLGVLNLSASSGVLERLYGTHVYPLTHLMIEHIQGSYLLFVLIIMTFYGGELVWRERSLKLSEVTDAMPVPSVAVWASKLTALILSMVVVLLAGMLTTIGFQVYKGFHQFELGLYFKGLFLDIGIPFLLIAILAFFLQVVANNKYLGFLLMVLYFLSLFVLPALHLEHRLYRYATVPESPYSDMNGYGHFVAPMLWFNLYWTFFAAALLVVVHVFWVRGTQTSLKERLCAARTRWGRAPKLAAACALVAFACTGAYIFYNTNILNTYRTSAEDEERSAEFEKKYKRYEPVAQPRVTGVRADVDIYPVERRVEIRGTYELVNKTAAPIRDVHVVLSPDVRIARLGIQGSREKMQDADLGYHIFELAPALQPARSCRLDFDLSVGSPGFVSGQSNTNVVHNGTFFNSFDYFPHLGYTRHAELQDPNKRKKYGLPAVQRMAKVDDVAARGNNYISNEADWITFETTVSTSPDQIAIAPGYLQREWVENGRRYFHYKMDSPILDFFSYLSAEYEVKRDRWNDVAIEVYYHQPHAYNVDRMIDSVKKSLDYFTANFSPYQHRQVRIVEFPRYARFAQSFPNTIPYSESIGFITDLRDPEAIDYVFYVTAHEVAHQWWAHQVIGGNVQGATLMSESLAQYAALMVMEKEYGADRMRKFLKYELDRYLKGRGRELIEELPLYLVENQPYIHYNKGSLTMYALRDYAGEQALNGALAGYVRAAAFQQPPYTNSIEFLSFIRPVVPDRLAAIVRDMFETMTLFDNRAAEVAVHRRGDGTYRVALTVSARKFRADGKGKETEIPINDWVDIAVLGEKEVGDRKEEFPLYIEKKLITQPSSTFEIIVDQPPAKAGIDPYNKLIDRNGDDNVKEAHGAG